MEGIQRRSRGPPRDIAEIPLDCKALLNPRETLLALYVSRMRLQGHKYRIRDDPIHWAHFRRYLHLLPHHAPPASTNYVQPRHLWEVQSGKAQGPDLRLPEADVGIDISWYRHLTEANQYALCAVMRSPPVCCTVGKRGRVTLLLKCPNRPVQEANLRGITISSHISKLKPTAFCAPTTAIYERALGSPCLDGGMRGVSLQEVVCTVHMKLDPARLQARVVDVLITDLAKFFDVIAQDVPPIVEPMWARERPTTSPPTRRASCMPCPSVPGSWTPGCSSWVPPRVQSMESMRGPRRLSPFCGSCTKRTARTRCSPVASWGSCG